MRIENENNGGKNCVVIPLVDIEEFKKSDYYKLLTESVLIDFMFVEDGSKDFHFSKSMNAGIKKAIDNGYKVITLSTNNINFSCSSNETGFIFYLDTIQKSTFDFHCAYHVVQSVNGNANRNILTDSSLKYLYTGIISKYPLFTLKRWLQMKKERMPNMYVTRTSLQSGFYGVMPFSIFSSEILKKYKFDENIKNSLEDTDLSYRLWKDGVPIRIIHINIEHRGNQSFKKINERDKLSGYYNPTDYRNNLIYMHNKYYGEGMKEID